MKVTALLPDELIGEVKDLSKGKNITESLIIALNEWISTRKIRLLNQQIKTKPVQFKRGFSASKVRQSNRKPRIS